MSYKYKKWFFLTLVLILGLAACAPTSSRADNPATESPESAPAPEEAPAVEADASLPVEQPPSGAEAQFSTDFSKHSISYSEVLSGGPPKDGIRAIDDPSYVSISEADGWIDDFEPIVFVQVGDEVRAYPLQILTWHEIVNDTLGGKGLVVTFCPLCNTAIAFERNFDGQILDFGTTGRLRFSNLIMYDRQTETWWQQATGDGVAGEYTGERLTFYPASIISWEDFKTEYPDGSVLSRDTGFDRSYGTNPYAGYDDISKTPFLYNGDYDDQLPPMARVLTVELNDETVAYTYNLLNDEIAINDEVGGQSITVFWTEGTASALDAPLISSGRDIGAAVAFSREVAGQTLTFGPDNGDIRDLETGSTWDIFGQATDGQLEGESLTPVVAVNHFWFSWAAFQPDTRIYQP